MTMTDLQYVYKRTFFQPHLNNTRNTIHCKTPRDFSLDKIIFENLHNELVITTDSRIFCQKRSKLSDRDFV